MVLTCVAVAGGGGGGGGGGGVLVVGGDGGVVVVGGGGGVVVVGDGVGGLGVLNVTVSPSTRPPIYWLCVKASVLLPVLQAETGTGI